MNDSVTLVTRLSPLLSSVLSSCPSCLSLVSPVRTRTRIRGGLGSMSKGSFAEPVVTRLTDDSPSGRAKFEVCFSRKT